MADCTQQQFKQSVTSNGSHTTQLVEIYAAPVATLHNCGAEMGAVKADAMCELSR
jgi:hypothetical protein